MGREGGRGGGREREVEERERGREGEREREIEKERERERGKERETLESNTFVRLEMFLSETSQSDNPEEHSIRVPNPLQVKSIKHASDPYLECKLRQIHFPSCFKCMSYGPVSSG